MMRDVELKILKLGVYMNSADFQLQPNPDHLKWSRYSGQQVSESAWVQELSRTTGIESPKQGILGASTLPGALALSPDCDLILKKLDAGDEVLATLFTLTYHFGDIAYLSGQTDVRPASNVPLLGLTEMRGYPQLVRLKKTTTQPLKKEGMNPIKGIAYEWAVSPIRRTGKAVFIDEKIKNRFLEVADTLGVTIEFLSKENQPLPFKRTDRVSNRTYQVERYQYSVPSELDVSQLWKVMDEQFSVLDKKRVDLKTLIK